MDQATQDAIALADELIELHRDLWEQTAKNLQESSNGKFSLLNGTPTNLVKMDIGTLFSGIQRSTLSL